MANRSILALLLVLMALLSCAYADDAAPNTLEQLPPGVTMVGGQEPIPATSSSTEQFIGGGRRFSPGFRYRFMFPFSGGFRYGWRYPIGYWNSFGRSIYGPRCLFGRPFGGFFYC
ncbi:hypothetical protein PHYPSEUDO_014514 [Phytophthora pseudosyringae]|uniref:Uncharacterized protein n=1 Tax=Phytophthora pseudosyringae TaxID=221518 RepID=A0A8T1V717_9STRA|nr:hypothetical protein PHYPSEUDO_014514 [Phytophthora pseudosyringae]